MYVQTFFNIIRTSVCLSNFVGTQHQKPIKISVRNFIISSLLLKSKANKIFAEIESLKVSLENFLILEALFLNWFSF